MDTTRQLLEVLEQLQEANPTMRFGQLVANISLFAKGPVKSAVWDVEDEELLKAAQSYLENLRRVDPAGLAALAAGEEITSGADVDGTDRR